MTLILCFWPASLCLSLTLACAGGYPSLRQWGPVDAPSGWWAVCFPNTPSKVRNALSFSYMSNVLVSAGLGSSEFLNLFIPWLLTNTSELFNDTRFLT